MLASLAVVAAIAETCGVSTSIKWPNDILFADSKVAGILIETGHDLSGRLIAVVGIGMNVNGHIEELAAYLDLQAPLGATATTLEAACGHRVTRETLIAHLLRHSETEYLALQREFQDASSVSQGTSGPISRLLRERWRSQLSTLGRTIEVHQGETVISGVAEDVNDNGELLLRRHSGKLVTITWGDVGYPVE